MLLPDDQVQQCYFNNSHQSTAADEAQHQSTATGWCGWDVNPMQITLVGLGLCPGVGEAKRGLKAIEESVNSQRDTETRSQTQSGCLVGVIRSRSETRALCLGAAVVNPWLAAVHTEVSGFDTSVQVMKDADKSGRSNKVDLRSGKQFQGSLQGFTNKLSDDLISA